MSNETQPLVDEKTVKATNVGWWEEEARKYQAQKDVHEALNSPLAQAFREAAKPHIHGPFTFLLNQNHNALRGCTTCGAAWVGSMAGNEENLRWHPVYEIEEE